MLVSSPENFEISCKRGFDIAGMKSRHRKKAERVRPGDKIIFYLTGVMAFGGTAEVTSTYYEDTRKVWECSDERKGESYPFRFAIRPELIADPADSVKVVDLLKKMKFVRSHKPEHWRLAFQGNVHILPEEDYKTIKDALKKAVKVGV